MVLASPLRSCMPHPLPYGRALGAQGGIEVPRVLRDGKDEGGRQGLGTAPTLCSLSLPKNSTLMCPLIVLPGPDLSAFKS